MSSQRSYSFSRQVLVNGIRDGIPIGLGYFAVSFSLGIAARKAGLSPFQGFLASLFQQCFRRKKIRTTDCRQHICGKKEDGYYEVRGMVMQTIQMHDQLEIKESKEPNKAYNQSAVPSVYDGNPYTKRQDSDG